ncbi:caspase family protein [Bradyrhizobium sp.]|uniref:caspase family protein n=1 Tax=Bradyrhizobium sp. TaxID=376 RepID=UPI001D829FC9|nr:caspase family protein [Bradyrhizobium sp.]MBI5318000.1 caspase family protein [Bradyrhizobium sp.]
MRRLAVSLLALAVLMLASTASPARAEKRVALVIGNSEYAHVPRLANPKNDAGDVRGKLGGLGYQLFGGADLDRAAMISAVTAFGRAAENADVAVVFYAGHGLQVNGQNYLVPVDASVQSEAELDISLVPMSIVMQQLSRGSRVNIAILDACRDNPFSQGLSRSMGTRAIGALGRGLSPMRSISGTYIAYATAPDSVAQDGEGRNSPFTTALLKFIDQAGLSLSDLMIEVRNEVIRTTNGKQVPWDTSSLTGRFYFKFEGTLTVEPAPPAAIAPAPAAPPAAAVAPETRTPAAGLDVQASRWAAAAGSNSAWEWQRFLDDFPQGPYTADAANNLGNLYATGNGVPRDDVRAASLYRRGAELGHPDAMTNYGIMLAGARGVPRDDAQAAALFRRAGNANGMQLLALLVDAGRGTARDPNEAADLFLECFRQKQLACRHILIDQRGKQVSLETRRLLQQKLAEKRIYQGPIDGAFSTAMIRALENFGR